MTIMSFLTAHRLLVSLSPRQVSKTVLYSFSIQVC